ncbi:branched-chain amino acid ABC transporter substrate-binding protein [Rhodospirillum centenum]|uniref:Leucine-, isoleucine-, valine-, threonine-, and alanine-binding protein n=1 Tax=Rhodospirillum centenum (strain ATCC 51521 / SW) TaxID=414684 RepID=B6ISN7_RHOCS|nr:branched-chain amino acid ABC transporter substrate-binding protein [Rhodospirillum centenum]ACI98473.1 leucine-, isoleucine-, valine-, threonine-, and alanine-binding protein [Rhodospirillum centenum SW]
MQLKTSLLALAAVATLAAAPARADIVVGLGAPITGPNAVFGEQMRRGTEMAVKDLNAKGGVLGETLRFVAEDDASNPSQGVAVANKMATAGAALVVGHFNSAVTIPAAKVYADEGILLITPASTNPQLTEQGLETVFRTCGRDDQQGDVAASYLIKNHRNDRIAVIHDQTTYGKGLADATKAAMNKGGLQEVMYQAVTVGERDMSALITRMRDAGVNVVYFGGLHTEGGLIVRQMADAGMKAVFMSGDGTVNQEFWNITGPTGEGALVTFGADYRDEPIAADVVKRFRDQGYEPEAYTLYSYAAVQAWAAAAEKAKSADAEKVAEALREGEYQTVIGPLSYDEKGDRRSTDYIIYRWSDGAYTPIK